MYYFDSGYNSPEPEAEEGVEIEYEPVVNFDLELYRYQRRQQFLEDYLESLNIQYNQFVLTEWVEKTRLQKKAASEAI